MYKPKNSVAENIALVFIVQGIFLFEKYESIQYEIRPNYRLYHTDKLTDFITHFTDHFYLSFMTYCQDPQWTPYIKSLLSRCLDVLLLVSPFVIDITCAGRCDTL